MDSLVYSIADFKIRFSVPDGNKARTILRTHEPFLVLDDIDESELLYTIRSVSSIEVPGEEFLIDEDEDKGFHSWMYVKDEISYIKYIHESSQITTILKWDSKCKIFDTDFSFTDAFQKVNVNVLTMTIFAIASALHGALKIHASVIEHSGRALLFLGVSGTGKSTHSRLWLNHVEGATLLNDDAPVVRILSEDTIKVYGTPWSGSTSCYRNISAEVVAFVHLYQHSTNDLSRENDIEALSSLLISSSAIRKDRLNKNLVFATITDILNIVPVYKLLCRPDLEALSLTRSLLNI